MKRSISILISLLSLFISCKKEDVPSLPENKLPIAHAGKDICLMLPANATRLTGYGESWEGAIIGYSWRQISGPSTFQIQNSGSSEISLTSLVAGEYVFEFKVTDTKGNTDIDHVTVTVSLIDMCCGCWDY